MTTREKLPSRRRHETQKVKVAGQTVHYCFGKYPDGRCGELFIEVSKAGAALRTWAGETAMMVSIAIQHGTPLETVLNLFIGSRSQPCGEVEGHPFIKTCHSIMDLIARDCAIAFLHRYDLADIPPTEEQIESLKRSEACQDDGREKKTGDFEDSLDKERFLQL